ncbi:winged helix-turn-helix transcriptional regulator [Natronorubrum sp. FCH18a]|uniref:winged helix-turn-helix transcriptional regulator n=1 Tax=Natronorubrum sp. FCH18a TaxID=3447018 RepID=UPI003F512CF2
MNQFDSDSREIIRAISHNNGRATTTEIRRETGLENSSVRYRYGKLENAGLIETQKDHDATLDGVAPMTVATITGKARRKIDEGLTFEQELQRAEVEPQDNADRIRELEKEIAEMREIVRTLKENQNWIGPQVEQLVAESDEAIQER